MYPYNKQTIFLLSAILIISCQNSLEFCNVMDIQSQCYQEPDTAILNEYDFDEVINETEIYILVQGNNTPAGFSYNLDNSFWIDTTKGGTIHLTNLSEGNHNILIRSYYPEGDYDPTPINLDFITDAIYIDFSYANCLSTNINSDIISYRFMSNSFIDGQPTQSYPNEVQYKWIFTNTKDESSSSLLIDNVLSTCYEFDQESDSLYYDVTLKINMAFTNDSFTTDSLTKQNVLIIPPYSNFGPGGF